MQLRQAWFCAVRKCRRRPQTSLERTPLERLCTTADQYEFLERRGLRYRIRTLLKPVNARSEYKRVLEYLSGYGVR